ncbi:cobyric acid synthase [Pseudonocardia sp. KRD-184]|uniref:Cobyric acid synthase n=1 Tax=Pseudonocardia oceani TaxID=2792013 RepID=A0ABS6U4I7_9PSEU|nr:cobyric acid synthase [Pseudonocardia oceani]MBW0093896.1 cobyric acid synthase [Pseudonocardia oceani]MBW0100504.1 cobyric acid synthase [Pseudonocardia oceani]MBW0125944.1 cobyric acid synthase [Pseudonocardia oceani]MBW0126883.1 cobyric acid synthase [Pseudonocardia oceani]
MRGGLLVAGTTSDAGKSALVAGICRMLARRGVRVAPFKAQNMSNNSVVTPDGGEIGRAQAMQAHACGLAPSTAFNPVLLKPGSDRSSQVVVLGRVDGTVSARSYYERKSALLDVVVDTLAGLRAQYDVVVCEGAGSPAEINLRASDIANMGLAQAADLPVVVVGDIDRGGVLAHLFGTLAVLDPADQARIAGFVINKFRGDPGLLAPGLDQLRALTGRPTLGVVPWADGLWLDAEDSLSVVSDGVLGRPAPPHGDVWLNVAVVRLPRISNATDAEALACEPGVAVRYVTEPSRLAGADLVVLPGSKATVADLAWLRRTGLADAVLAHARAGRPVLGICGGYQMLGRTIADPHGVESGGAEGLGLLDLEIVFDVDKHLATPHGTAWGEPVSGYEIHHGRVVRSGDPGLVGDEGSETDRVWGTHWHGLLENDGFRRRLLERVGRPGFVVASGTCFADERERQLDLLGDLVEQHLDIGSLEHVISHGAARDLPVVTTGLAVSPS